MNLANYRKTAEAVSRLTPEQYRVTQQNGTEAPGTGDHLDNEEPGIYVDIVSGEPLFASSDKFESGCGWPSFTKPIEPTNINELQDTTPRTEKDPRQYRKSRCRRNRRGAQRRPYRLRFREKRGDADAPWRVGQPRDIAAVVVFLASEDAAWVTGERLFASGGR